MPSFKVHCFRKINEMLDKLDKDIESWREEWDDHYGDLSASQYDFLIGQKIILQELKENLNKMGRH
mgnify:CR=1 FL=1|tara:strand:- start:271 stop:468 length:198 start_codon:yes stop_codon:yes gene_type:complete